MYQLITVRPLSTKTKSAHGDELMSVSYPVHCHGVQLGHYLKDMQWIIFEIVSERQGSKFSRERGGGGREIVCVCVCLCVCASWFCPQFSAIIGRVSLKASAAILDAPINGFDKKRDRQTDRQTDR